MVRSAVENVHETAHIGACATDGRARLGSTGTASPYTALGDLDAATERPVAAPAIAVCEV